MKPVSSLLHLVLVEFNPTTYTVTEGVDNFAELTLVRSGYLAQTTTVTVSFQSGTATGMSSLKVDIIFSVTIIIYLCSWIGLHGKSNCGNIPCWINICYGTSTYH